MDITKCKSYSEIGRLLGYCYYNKHVKKEILEYCKHKNINIDEFIKNNNKPNICLQCGKEITGKNKHIKKFCNSTCAAIFNNKGRVQNEKTKEKISNTLKEKYKNGEIINHKIIESIKDDNLISDRIYKIYKMSELISEGLILNPNNIIYKDCKVSPNKYKEKKCVVCGIFFKPTLTKGGKISLSKTCSKECHQKLKIANAKMNIQKIIKDGRHQGWKSRNIISYPEKFWIKVLDNNSIEYVKEHYVENKYFLDFFIEKDGIKIDLEIDGKQHLYDDRKNHDIERDKYLTEKGYIVYRIPWNEINTKQGKEKMKQKIDNFLYFLKKNKK